MKLTTARLKKLIREELQRLNELKGSQKREMFARSLPSMDLKIDETAMTASDRKQAVDLLHEALDYLSESENVDEKTGEKDK